MNNILNEKFLVKETKQIQLIKRTNDEDIYLVIEKVEVYSPDGQHRYPVYLYYNEEYRYGSEVGDEESISEKMDVLTAQQILENYWANNCDFIKKVLKVTPGSENSWIIDKYC